MTSRKTILILMHNADLQFIDIANQYVKLFDPAYYKVTVAYLSGNTDEQAKQKTLAEEVIFFAYHKKNIRGLKLAAIQKLTALCQQEQFSMVICHRYKPIYVMLWAARFCHVPTIIFIMHAMSTIKQLTRKLLIATLMRDNMYFAGVSNAVRDDLRKSLWSVPQEKIITLYNCIDIAATKKKLLSQEAARAALHLSADTFVIGTIARLAPEKDQQTMLHAFAKIKPNLPHAKLVIIGSGVLEKELKELANNLHIADAVIFTGFIAEAMRYLKAFDIFVLSSTKEAFGRVLIEAMAAKIPLIGTRINGIPEVIADAGHLVPAKNREQLAAAMLKLAELTALERETLGEQGYKRMQKYFSLEKFNEDFWEHFLHLRHYPVIA